MGLRRVAPAAAGIFEPGNNTGRQGWLKIPANPATLPLIFMRIVELGHKASDATGGRLSNLRAMILQSVGPVRHEVSVPFHDSQVGGIALLIQTGWDERWGTESYWEPGPFLAEHLIFRCVRSRVAVIGVDFPVSGHSAEAQLITKGRIPIVENLCGLASLPRVGFEFSVVPLLTPPADISAVRAFAVIPT